MRIIDAELLKRLAERLIKDEECYNTSPKSWAEEIENFKCLIDSIPTIEAKPVVHAHWNDDGRCTNCGEHAPFLLWADTWHESEYCHGCGAQMDEVVSDTNVGSKGVKIPVISMEDVPKIMEETK